MADPAGEAPSRYEQTHGGPHAQIIHALYYRHHCFVYQQKLFLGEFSKFGYLLGDSCPIIGPFLSCELIE